MLYVTTRNKFDAYTTKHALWEQRAIDGGLYVPMHIPEFSFEELSQFGQKGFGQIVSEILNLFFTKNLTQWDVEFSTGRYPVKIKKLKQKLFMAELWYNSVNRYAFLEKTLIEKIDANKKNAAPEEWVRVAVRLAIFAACYALALKDGHLEPEEQVDISLAAGDLSGVMAVLYAKKMGIPVGNILCGCKENDGLWDLLHSGQVRTDLLSDTQAERLIYVLFGCQEACRYCDAVRIGEMYRLQPEALKYLKETLFAAVVSEDRLNNTIPSVYRTVGQILGPEAALAYSTTQDYCARNGDSRKILLLCDDHPACYLDRISDAMGINPYELTALLNKN